MFIADYHALTTVHDGNVLRRNSLMLAEALLALGIDPEQTTFFQQSHLFVYPVIMAADILIYQSDIVPVGKDQIAHVKMARQMATHFNEAFGPTFKSPKAVLSEVPKVPGLDGEKMSKSYGNTISVFDRGDTLRAKLAGIKTTSTPYGDPLPTDDCHLFELLKLMCTSSGELDEVTKFFRTGRRGSQKFGYGHAKELLAEKIETTFAEAEERRQHLMVNPIEVMQALDQGATRARRIADKTLNKCRSLCGIG
jgi:tryptophanyl-tRNA synthetase